MNEISPTRLLLIRHAEVEEKYQHVFGGIVDMNLSPLGHEQAGALAAFLRRRKIDSLYASPMLRVQQTLAPFLGNGAPTPRMLPDLREVDFGDWTGHGWTAVHEKFGVSAYNWLEQLERDAIPNAENFAAYRHRVQRVLDQILSEPPGRVIAVFCHGGVIRMLLALLLNLPYAKMESFAVDYASVTEIALKQDRTEIQLLNFIPWREPTP